jgi:tRNA (guanine-N7-)-methyltransferase
MGHKKLIKFEAIKNFNNVLEYPENTAGNWHTIIGNKNENILELACGRGEYTIGLALLNPTQNFIGVDIKGNRIWKGAKFAVENNLNNAYFLRTQIDKIATYFAQDEVSEIWITFPDPQLRASKLTKRLTHPKFLKCYQQFLKPDGKIHLKTDSPDLYQFTKWVIELCSATLHVDYNNLYAQPNLNKALEIKTYYESLDIAKSNTIHYLCFSLPKQIPNNIEGILKEKVFNDAESKKAAGFSRR